MKIDMFKTLTTFTDGGARGNPGPAGIGMVIKHGAEVIEAFGRYIGETTNNQAEYKALIAVLERVFELGAEEVHCMLDSELVVKQMRHEYKVRDAGLQSLFLRAWNLVTGFKRVTFTHVPREENSLADAEVNAAIDNHLKHR
jgi:ribonuclease HI